MSAKTRPPMASVGRMTRAQALADALERVLSTPGPLSPFATELRSLAAIERSAAQRAARIAQGREAPPQRRASPAPTPVPAVAESRPNFFRDFFGDDAEAIARELREGP